MQVQCYLHVPRGRGRAMEYVHKEEAPRPTPRNQTPFQATAHGVRERFRTRDEHALTHTLTRGTAEEGALTRGTK